MAVSEQLKQLVAEMPDPDGRGMFTENIDKAKIEKAVGLIAEGGAGSMGGLIEMLGEPGTAENAKPHYALHCVINHALVAKNERLRKAFCEMVAKQVTNEKLSTYNRAYLCQELQWAGREESCAALGNVLLDEELTEAASMALAAIGGERAASQLRAAVPNATGKCRLCVIDALAALADQKAAAIFKQALGDDDREVRLAAGSGLSRLGDGTAADLLIRAADCDPGWERIRQTKHCMVLAEKLIEAGDKPTAARIYEHLRDTRSDPSEKYIRDAAEAALK